MKSFRDVAEFIFYDLDNNYSLKKDSKGNFYVNKLYITPTQLSYKTELYSLKPGLFNKVEKLYRLLKD